MTTRTSVPARLWLGVCLVLGLTAAASGQTTYTWNFGILVGNPAPTSGLNPNLSVGTVNVGNTNGIVNPSLSTTNPSTGYTGASGQFNIGNAAVTGPLNTGASAFFSFTVVPVGGATGVQLNSISFGSRSDATGPQAVTVRSSVDGYTTDIVTPVTVGNNGLWSLSGPAITNGFQFGSSVQFRIYGYNGTGTPTDSAINWQLDDLSVGLTPVPEPGSVLAVGTAVLGLGAFTRRKLLGKPTAA